MLLLNFITTERCEHTSHGDTVNGADTKELLESLRETRAELKDNEKDEIEDVGPFSAVTIRPDSEDDSTDGAEHENQGDTPGNVCLGVVETCS